MNTSVSATEFYSRIRKLDSFTINTLKNNLKKKGTGNVTTNILPNQSLNISIENRNTNLTNVEILDSNVESNKGNNVTGRNVVVAITEGRGTAQGQIGLAFIDIHSPVLYLSQICDNYMYGGLITKLNVVKPTEIIITKAIYQAGSKVLEIIRKNFSEVLITPLPRKHFNAEDGLTMIKLYSTPESKANVGLYDKKYYALTAAAALLKYIKTIRMISFLENSLRIEFQTRQSRMLLGNETYSRLELLCPNVPTRDKKTSLLGVLDHTVTAIGKKFLRARIFEPFTDISDIIYIQQTIEELQSDSELLMQLTDVLIKFHNVDKILKISIQTQQTDLCKAVESMLNDILLLKTNIENIPELAILLRPCKSFLLQKIYTNLSDSRLQVILVTINDIIRPEVQFVKGSFQCFQRVHAIKPNIDDTLDMLRDSYNKLTDEIYMKINNLATEYELPLKMSYSIAKGFHIQYQISKAKPGEQSFPSELNMIYKKNNFIYFTNTDLISLNLRINEIVNEIYKMSEQIVRNLLGTIMQYFDASFILVEAISNLDIYQSFTKLSSTDGYCCPTFGDEMRITDAIHPLLENTRNQINPVPNNIICTPEYNLFIITGPNMGGKTIYLKTIALLQIMAQLGCYVPATQAQFRICDSVFTRLGFDEKFDKNSSSFVYEIKEYEYIFQNITPRSLVLIDEIFRSTNPCEGAELAWDLCKKFCTISGEEYEETSNHPNAFFEHDEATNTPMKLDKPLKLIKIITPFIFISTHYLQLTKFKDFYYNAVNLHLSAEVTTVNNKTRINYLHKVLEGPTPIRQYGIILAQNLPFPKDFYTNIEKKFKEITSKPVESSTVDKSKDDDIFEGLEKTLNDSFGVEEFQMPKQRANLITSFINSVDESNLEYQLENVPSKEIVQQFKFQLYELYSEIAGLLRSNNHKDLTSLKPDLEKIFTSFISYLPNELRSIIGKEKNITNLIREPVNILEPTVQNSTNRSISPDLFVDYENGNNIPTDVDKLLSNYAENKLSNIFNKNLDNEKNINTSDGNSANIECITANRLENLAAHSVAQEIEPKKNKNIAHKIPLVLTIPNIASQNIHKKEKLLKKQSSSQPN